MILVMVHHPATKEGAEQLRRRLAAIHAKAVLDTVSVLKGEKIEKEELIVQIIEAIKEK